MRLSNETLCAIPATVARPAYDRAAITAGVVHLGIGAFHRAHQAAVFEAALASGDMRWGVIGVSLRSTSVWEQMAPQDGLYTLLVRDDQVQRPQIMGVVQRVLVAPEEPKAVIAALADARTHLVTLTVTEKGYALDRTTNELDLTDAQVAADLASLDTPRTAIGFLVAGLAVRRASGLAPFTAISCDNLPHNGELLRAAVLAMARAHDRSLAAWIAAEGAFPATMVDRIVPATTAGDIDATAQLLGLEDRAMVKSEPFTQWVIEDQFAGPRPDFAGLGVELTHEVSPWETAKLRLLNGAHSAIAYLGGLAGIDFVHEFVARSEGRALVEALWSETATTLVPVSGLDLQVYLKALSARFANASLQHRTRQIAQDGSLKLPQRLVAPLLAVRAGGGQGCFLTLAIAAWMRWQAGTDDAGDAFAVDDPAAGRLAELLRGRLDTAGRADALLSFDAVFPSGMARDATLRDDLVASLSMIERDGAWHTMVQLLKREGWLS